MSDAKIRKIGWIFPVRITYLRTGIKRNILCMCVSTCVRSRW